MPPKGKGKDFNRMGKPSPTPPAPESAAPAPTGEQQKSNRPLTSAPSPRGQLKGKEFSRLTKPPGASPTPPVVPTSQPPSVAPVVDAAMAEKIRRQNAARVAAGMAPLSNTTTTTSSSLQPVAQIPPTSLQALKPNAPPKFNTSVPTATQKQEAQHQEQLQREQWAKRQQVDALPIVSRPPTQRPFWSEGRLSTMDIAGITKLSTANKKMDGAGTLLAPFMGEKLQTLCNSIDPSYTLNSEVQERIVEMADSFVEKVTKDAIRLSKHRSSNCMEVQDVALALKKGYNMEIPGLSPIVAGGSGDNNSGWLLTDKIKGDAGNEPANKKRKTSGPAAAAASM